MADSNPALVPAAIQKKKKVAKSFKAGVLLPVGRLIRKLKMKNPNKRISPEAGVFIAGALQYLVSEVMELAGQAALKFGKPRISPRHVYFGAANDAEINNLLSEVIMAGGGVLPNIHPALLPQPTSIPVIAPKDNEPKSEMEGNRE